MCVACGDIASAQSTVSVAGTTLTAAAPLVVLLLYRAARLVRIPVVERVSTHWEYGVLAVVAHGVALVVTYFSLLFIHLWLPYVVAMAFFVYTCVWLLVGHSFSIRSRTVRERTWISVHAFIASAVWSVVLWFLLLLVPYRFPLSFVLGLVTQLTISMVGVGVLIVYGVLAGFQLARHRVHR